MAQFDVFDFSEVISLFGVSVSDTHWGFCKEKGAWVSGVCPWEIGVRETPWRICRHCRCGVSACKLHLCYLKSCWQFCWYLKSYWQILLKILPTIHKSLIIGGFVGCWAGVLIWPHFSHLCSSARGLSGEAQIVPFPLSSVNYSRVGFHSLS